MGGPIRQTTPCKEEVIRTHRQHPLLSCYTHFTQMALIRAYLHCYAYGNNSCLRAPLFNW